MSSPESDPRQPEAEIEDWFVERWSPRAYRPDPVPLEDLASMFEAARWAPSCFNAQPWTFYWADSGADREAFRELLVDGNRWADAAPVVGFVVATKDFPRNQKPNAWAEFDSGAAWMNFSLQAWALGYATHGMGGFHRDRAYEVLGLDPAKVEVVAAFVVGRPGAPASLSEELRQREVLSPRKPLVEVQHRGPRRD